MSLHPSSADGQVQREVSIRQWLEAKVFVETFSNVVFGVHDQRVGGDLGSRFQAAIYGTTDKDLAQAAASLIGPTRQPTHTEAGHRKPWQPLAVQVGQPRDVDLGCAERGVAEDGLGRSRIDQNVRRSNTFAPMLFGESLKVFVECNQPTIETPTVVDGGVERMLLKHAEPGAGIALARDESNDGNGGDLLNSKSEPARYRFFYIAAGSQVTAQGSAIP